ncbi:MAG: hypothetical protein HYZ54_06465 [Ignavibacteriae bacterium]|nr:hypothetical protein [Ignavibacteriota bacterium]
MKRIPLQWRVVRGTGEFPSNGGVSEGRGGFLAYLHDQPTPTPPERGI